MWTTADGFDTTACVGRMIATMKTAQAKKAVKAKGANGVRAVAVDWLRAG